MGIKLKSVNLYSLQNALESAVKDRFEIGKNLGLLDYMLQTIIDKKLLNDSDNMKEMIFLSGIIYPPLTIEDLKSSIVDSVGSKAAESVIKQLEEL